MREHGTRACYVFGTEPGSDRSRGCRCEPCKEANRVYARGRDRATRRPDVLVEAAYIDSVEVRRHLRWLETKGVGLRTISRRARVARSSLIELRSGARRRCARETEKRILLVFPADAADSALIDAAPTWRLINELRAQGHTKTSIARSLGCGSPALQLGRNRITARNARRVKALHSRLMLGVLADRRLNSERRRLYRREIAS